MSVGQSIRILRKKAGFTQKQLAERVGVNEVTIRSYEAGKYNPKINILTRLCIALDCKITDLIDEDNKKYYRMFDNEKVTEKIDYEHSHSYASSAEELDKRPKERQIEPTKKEDNNIHKYDASIRISPEALENLKEISIIYKKIENGEKLTDNDLQTLKNYNQRQKIAMERLKETLRTMQEKLRPLIELQSAYDKLNEVGQEEAIKRIEELTEIPRYTRTDEPPQE